MRKLIPVTVALTAALAPAATLLAAEAAEEGKAESTVMAFDLFQFFMAIVVFGIAFFILSKTAWPKIMSGLEARESKIKGDLADAERAREQAQASLEQYERALAQARAEAASIVDEARTNQQKLAAELKARTEAELQQMRDSAKRDIASAKAAAIAELHAHVADLSTDIAAKILRRELSAVDQRALVDDSLNQLAASN